MTVLLADIVMISSFIGKGGDRHADKTRPYAVFGNKIKSHACFSKQKSRVKICTSSYRKFLGFIRKIVRFSRNYLEYFNL